jgi:hypothetical protein
MPTSTIFIDVNRLLDDQNATMVVEKVSDYPYAYLALKEAIHGGSAVFVHVRNHTVATWLSQCAASYGDTYITLRTYAARDALKDRWQIAIPPDVFDQDILQSGLLDVQVILKEGQEFWDILLENFYADVFTYKVFPSGKLSALVNGFHRTQWQATDQRPLVVRAQRDKFMQWMRTADSDAIRTIVQHLMRDTASLRRDLINYKVLRNYPQRLGEKVVSGLWETFSRVHVEVEDLEYTKEDVSIALHEIEYYLTDMLDQVKSASDLEMLIDQMSGYLHEEFNYIERIARKHPEYLTPVLLQHIEQRFRPIKGTIENELIWLRRMLRPDPPQEPVTSWSTLQWLAWATDSYMPFYTWLDAQSKREPEVANQAFLFADWYYEHFIAIKNGEPQYFAYNALYQERERMNSGDAITLVLIVDNLNFMYFDELRQQFNQQGFTLQEVKPLFSLIPTATEVGKAALIAGQGDQIDFSDERYAELVVNVWEPMLHGKKVKYLRNIGELHQERALAHDAYFLNYLPIDIALHQDNRDSGRSHAEVIHENLVSLAKAIANFTKRFQLEQRLSVYIISDHGSTRIPQEAVNVIDQKFFKGLTLEKHHRFIPISDENFEELPQLASSQCYLIDRQVFKTNKNYLIARQYYRFLKTQENFYVHGGLTPEEVIVPFARFTCEPVTPTHPTIRLVTKEFRYAVRSKIVLEVGNPNAFSLEALNLRLLDADAEEVFILSLATKQIMTVEFNTIFRKALGTANTRTLTLRVRYECQGRAFIAPDQPFDITLKSLMEVSSDDFDF